MQNLRVFFLSAAILFFFCFQVCANDIDSALKVVERPSIVTVRGNSLSPLFLPEQDLEAIYGYYDTHPVERNDIALIKISGWKNTLIKIVKGLPQDRFSFSEAKEPNTWYFLINDEVLKNSEGKEYFLSQRKYNLWQSYYKQFNGMIPEDYYLILGNLPAGSRDSMSFGFVQKANLAAKVLYDRAIPGTK